MRFLTAALLFALLLPSGWAIEKSPAAKPAIGKRLSLAFLAGMRNVKADFYEPVYGTAKMFYRGEIGYRAAAGIEALLGAEYFKADGSLTHTGEPTRLTITPIELGVRLLAGKRNLLPYAGAGVGYYMIKEENVIGTVDEKKIGFYGEGGLKYRFGRSLFADARLKYVMVKLSTRNVPAVTAEMGGLVFAAGMGFMF